MTTAVATCLPLLPDVAQTESWVLDLVLLDPSDHLELADVSLVTIYLLRSVALRLALRIADALSLTVF